MQTIMIRGNLIDIRSRDYVRYPNQDRMIPKRDDDDDEDPNTPPDPNDDIGDKDDQSGTEEELEQINRNIVDGNTAIADRLDQLNETAKKINRDNNANSQTTQSILEDIRDNQTNTGVDVEVNIEFPEYQGYESTSELDDFCCRR